MSVSRSPGGCSIDEPPWATATSWKARTWSGEPHLNATVPPLPGVAGMPPGVQVVLHHRLRLQDDPVAFQSRGQQDAPVVDLKAAPHLDGMDAPGLEELPRGERGAG